MWSLTVLLVSFVTQCVVPSVNAGYTFEMLLIGYQNPSHRSSRGGLCERGDDSDPCDNAFKICFRHRDSPESSSCDIGKFQTEKIVDDNDNLVFMEGESIGGVHNPITVTGDTWPGQQIEIKLSVYDIDGDDRGITHASDPVTLFVIHPNVTASVNGLFSEQYNLTSYYSSLQLTFRLTCLPPHSGPDCSLIYDRSSTYSSHRVTPTSITSVMVSPSPTVVRPSPEDQTPSIPLVTLAIICTGAGVLLSIIIVVVLLVILIIRKRNEEKIDDSAFRLLHDVDVTEKKKCEEHLYDTASSFRNSSISSPPVHATVTSPPPVYAAVKDTYHIAQEDPDGMAMEKNISYARVDVERNVAYGVVVGQRSQHRPMMPLPDQ